MASPLVRSYNCESWLKKYERIFGGHTRFGVTERLPTDLTLEMREFIANAVAIDGALILSKIHNHWRNEWAEAYKLTEAT